ncbi:MAG TPA: PKD domain-containing protein [Bacteroidia bacterium]|jgi:PKD repeat protein|nr:PKD domain-containing protein [Bacteroidia bacterium]
MKKTLFLLIVYFYLNSSFSATIYYSKSVGNLNTPATWGTNTNGTGTAPANFTTANCTYIIVNNPAPTISANWTVSGLNSKVLVGDGTQTINFTVPSPRSTTATYSVMVGSTLTAASGSTISGSTINVDGTFNNGTNNNPAFGTLSVNSTVIYSRAGNQSIVNTNYYNLTTSGSGAKRLLNAGNTIVTNSLTLNTGPTFVLNTNNALTLFLNGTVAGAGTITGSANSNLSIGGTGTLGTLTFTAGALSLYKFTINRTGSGLVTLGTALTVSNAFTHTIGTLNLNGKTLTLNGAITFPTAVTSGSFSGSSTSGVSIGGAGAITNSLYMTQSGTSNYLNNFTLNRSGQTLTLGNTLNLVGVLTPTAGTFASAGNLILIATSSTVVARIGVIGGSVTGNVTAQMFAKGGTTGWTLMGSPGLTGRTFSDWNDNITITCANCPNGFWYSFTSVNWYDETVGGLYSNASRYKNIVNITDPMTIGKGYWVYLGTSTYTTTNIMLDATGPANQGNFAFNLTRTNIGGGTNATDHGYNLICNPYSSPILWSSLRAGNGSVANAIYVYNPDLAGYASYVGGVSNPAVGSGGIGNAIPAGQGFYVKVNAATATLTAKEANKTASAQELLRTNTQQTTSALNPMVMRLKANGHNMNFETAIYFDANATTSYDDEYDAMYMGADAGHLGIGTRLNGSDYAINGLPALNQNYSIPVMVTTDTTDTYSITGTDLQNLPGGACIVLHDNYTGLDKDLRSGSYSCTIHDTEKIVARFVLNITVNTNLQVTGNAVNPTCNSSADGYITANANNAGPWNYYWKDANNNIIKTSLNKATTDTLFNVNAGNYSVDVNTAGSCDNGTQSFTLQGVSSTIASYNPSATSVVFIADSIGVTFTNTSSNANTYWWDFGDGNGGPDTNVTHQYTTPGNYLVTLVSYNSACGDSSVYTQIITIIDGSAVGIAAVAEPTKNMFINRDAGGYYVKFNYANTTNAVINVTNILGEKVITDLKKENVSTDKVYIPLGDNNNKILIISVVTETGEKTYCKIVNY